MRRKMMGNRAMDIVPRVIQAMAQLFQPSSFDGLTEEEAMRLSWSVSGLTVQADWIGSNENWFPPKSETIPISEYWTKARSSAAKAVAEAGFSFPAPAREAKILPPNMIARPMQDLCKCVKLPEGPMMAIIEDVTGAGKTEAALILANRMLGSNRGRGLFFALPTMATSNAMLARMERVGSELFDGTPSLALTHGHAKSNRLFKEIQCRSATDPENEIVCGEWLSQQRRRVLLADIGVGTIDQALLAVLPTRFHTLRLWALSDRILIVDEAHSYDPYMEAELCRLLEFQAWLGGSVILMTATLPCSMRSKFSKAFQTGLGCDQVSEVCESGFPLLTMVATSAKTYKPVPHPQSNSRVRVSRSDQQHALRTLCDAVAAGAACLWVRNAVDDAVAAVDQLNQLGIEAQLLHSRFTVADRLEKEDRILELYGRDRPVRQPGVLVATQVVETSLDLDFDLLVSDLAPIGALIQRAGRLWRHMDLRPKKQRPVSSPCMHIVSPDPNKVEDNRWLHQCLESGAWVYPQDIQWRSAQAIFKAGEIDLPNGLRSLIESVHGDDPAPVPDALEFSEISTYAEGLTEAQQARNNLICLSSYIDGSDRVWDDNEFPTRLSEPQITLALATRELTPFTENWEMSEVQISAKLYSKCGRVPQSPEIESVKAKWPKWRRKFIDIAIVGENGGITDSLFYSSEKGLIRVAN